MSREIIAFIPGKKFPSISITGTRCWLMCSYCRGRYLHGMIPAESPEELYHVAGEIYSSGGYGLLISGGFTRDGYLPIKPYLPVIKRIKKEYGLIISVHPGLIDNELINGLREAGVDIVDYELVLDQRIISDLKHLDKTVNDYIDTYELLISEGPPHVVPHIPIGFIEDDQWIYLTIDLLKKYDPEITVFLVAMQSDVEIIDRVLSILRYAGRELGGEISLGCMRPYKLKTLLDKKVIEEKLVDRIVNPLKKYIEKYRLRVVEACCSIPHSIVDKLI